MKPKIEEEELLENDLPQGKNVVRLETITGGKGPPGSDFWLKEQKVGTVFLARPKGNTMEAARSFGMLEFAIFNISRKGNYLLREAGNPNAFWADPVRFSNQLDLVEILRIHEIEDAGDDDGSNRPVRQERLEDDEDASP